MGALIAVRSLFGALQPSEEQMNKVLTPQRVEEIFMGCLFEEGEDTSDYVFGEGITKNVGFHPERLEAQREDIEAMLMELPDSFMASKGGGMSFLRACMTRDEHLWTGEHLRMEQLFTLGLAIKKAKFAMPRMMWGALPHGMPYYIVLDQPVADDEVLTD